MTARECLPTCLRPCVATFDRLAREAPELLIAWVQTGYGLDAADLSAACEALGAVRLQSAVGLLELSAVGALERRLAHESPIVREGACLGLAPLARSCGGGVAALQGVAQHDPSPGVRAAAREALDT